MILLVKRQICVTEWPLGSIWGVCANKTHHCCRTGTARAKDLLQGQANGSSTRRIVEHDQHSIQYSGQPPTMVVPVNLIARYSGRFQCREPPGNCGPVPPRTCQDGYSGCYAIVWLKTCHWWLGRSPDFREVKKRTWKAWTDSVCTCCSSQKRDSPVQHYQDRRRHHGWRAHRLRT